MKRVYASGSVVKGIDIYHGDLISNIEILKGSGIMYAFLKAFEYSVDSRFQARWKEMKVAGIIRGAYDFFHPSKDPIAQAVNFLKIVGPLEVGDLPCVLDWETTDNVPSATDRERGLAWLNTVEKSTGIAPYIYASPYFLDALRLDSRFKKYLLWVAEYGANAPLVPNPWDTWTFWQTSETGNVPGINGHCDKDVFNGTLDQLRALTKR